MEDYSQFHAGRGQSRFSKALPVPPPSLDPGRRGKTTPFPAAQRALPPPPTSNMSSTSSIPRRPVGGQKESTEPSIRSISSTYPESPIMLPNYEAYLKKEAMENVEAERTPPPPPKHIERRKLPELPKEPNHVHTISVGSTTSSTTSSSPRPELWRRRSVKSDRSVSIPDLKLAKSNGSTGITPANDTIPALPLRQDSLLPQPSQNARTLVGLPGRSIKPVPAAAAPPHENTMGPTISKISKIERKPPPPVTDRARSGEKPTNIQASPVARLPTPEYHPTEAYLMQMSPNVVSPPSPETPPVDSHQELGAPYVHKAPNSSHRPPTTRSSQRTDSEQPLPPIPASAQEPKPRIPSLLAIRRPPSTSAPSPTTGLPTTPDVYASSALSVVHLDCYQAHRLMRTSRNDTYPLECMICEVRDAERRWMCTWCCLRCCDPCMKSLASVPGKDLRKCLEWIGRADRVDHIQGDLAVEAVGN